MSFCYDRHLVSSLLINRICVPCPVILGPFSELECLSLALSEVSLFCMMALRHNGNFRAVVSLIIYKNTGYKCQVRWLCLVSFAGGVVDVLRYIFRSFYQWLLIMLCVCFELFLH